MHREQKNPSGFASYFLTFNVADWVDVFVRPLYKLVMVDALNYHIQNNGLIVHSWCLMSNHLHLLARAKDDVQFPVVIRDLKKYMTQKILEAIAAEPDLRKEWMLKRFEEASISLKRIEKYQLWQNCSHTVHIQANNAQLQQHYIDYIHQNPVRDKITDHAEEYVFSSARDYAGSKGLVKVQVLSIPKAITTGIGNFPGLLMN